MPQLFATELRQPIALALPANIRVDRNYCILSSKVRPFYKENDAEIFPAHYTWKAAKKAFKMAFMMNKFAMSNSCENFLEK